MNETKFAVSRFENRNGVTSWRVAGWLHGVRIRKNFLTKEEAAAEKATLEIKAAQVSAGFRPAMTLLTDLQAGNSEAIIRKHYLDQKNPSEAEEYFSGARCHP